MSPVGQGTYPSTAGVDQHPLGIMCQIKSVLIPKVTLRQWMFLLLVVLLSEEHDGASPTMPTVLAIKQDFNKHSEFAIIHRFSHVTEHGLHPSVHLCIYSFTLLLILLLIIFLLLFLGAITYGMQD